MIKNIIAAGRTHWAVLLLFLLGLALRLYMIQADDFLHEWDERFHALVARNMIEKPFEPTLQREILGIYDPNSWCCNTIWLHKQPLFLWQMAASMQIFGVSEWAMRLPSAVMGALMILMLYRCTFLLTGRRDTAFLAAALLAFSNFQLQLTTGIMGMDHNDMALQFYILLSFWAFSERYIQLKNTAKAHWAWAVLIGVAAGAAVLNKWLLGLAVFLPWGLLTLWDWYGQKRIAVLRDFVLALLVCLLVFVPWQVYILQTWQDLAQHEYEFNNKHIFEAVEGHTGTNWYYFEHAGLIWGNYICYLLPLGLLAIGQKSKYERVLAAAYVLIALFVFSFFSFVVATKIKAYISFISPFFMILMAVVAQEFVQRVSKYVYPFCLLVMVYFSLNPTFFLSYYSADNTWRNEKIANAKIYRNLKNELPADCRTVTNLPEFGHIELQFYAPEIRANHWCLSPAVLDSLAVRKEIVAAFKSRGQYQLSEAANAYPYLLLLEAKVNGH
jgi:4-amino-4-deoxy-L-arabinose transferase-like glycosyltransferase